MPPTKKTRRHGAAPANWQFREGRPRWIPAPGLRAAGWKGHDLKDRAGAWLSEGASIDRAREINAAVAGWRAGALVPSGFAAIAPTGAAETAGAGLPLRADRLSIGALADKWTGDPARRIPPSEQFRELARATQGDYRGKLKRLIDVLSGYLVLPARNDPKGQAAYAEAVADTRARSVLSLEPAETKDGVLDLLFDAYWALHDKAGKHQAAGVLAVASVWLAWCRKRQSRTIRNWAAEVSRATPPGRLRVLTWDEVTALFTAAEAMGLHSIADAIVLGVDLGWSQVDRLALTWDRVRDGRALTGTDGRQKTGRVGGTPFLSLGSRRLLQIRERQLAMPARPTHVIWCERTGAPWKADHYRHAFAEVRALAAAAAPSVADATDADLRDTAFTIGRDAGLDNDGSASRSLQKRRSVNDLADRHYGEIGPHIADRARDLVDAHMIAKGMVL